MMMKVTEIEKESCSSGGDGGGLIIIIITKTHYKERKSLIN
jgi:hypothetical protein